MSSDLSPQNEQFIQQAVANGLFPSRQAALDAAVERLRKTGEEPQVVPKEHMGLVEEGLQALERGLGVPWDAPAAKLRLRQRLASQSKTDRT